MIDSELIRESHADISDYFISYRLHIYLASHARIIDTQEAQDRSRKVTIKFLAEHR